LNFSKIPIENVSRLPSVSIRCRYILFIRSSCKKHQKYFLCMSESQNKYVMSDMPQNQMFQVAKSNRPLILFRNNSVFELTAIN